ncbi:MAG: PepSY-like domain-containing protein [Muribaculaceae bacterium]|nr:PepSY-like domain-containing protein [Muribaculaceae bacterium]
MKTHFIFGAAFVAVVALSGYDAQARRPDLTGGNPGIVISGSQDYDGMPEKAKHFISKHFSGVGISKCEKYFAKGKYEVELANGVDMEFNTKGELTEIDAPDNAFLAPSIVKELLHRSAYSHLEKDGLDSKVESIEFNRGKAVEVELGIPDPDTYVFDIDGNFIAIRD